MASKTGLPWQHVEFGEFDLVNLTSPPVAISPPATPGYHTLQPMFSLILKTHLQCTKVIQYRGLKRTELVQILVHHKVTKCQLMKNKVHNMFVSYVF